MTDYIQDAKEWYGMGQEALQKQAPTSKVIAYALLGHLALQLAEKEVKGIPPTGKW